MSELAKKGHPHVGDRHRIRIRVLNGDEPVALTGPVTLRLTRPNNGASSDFTDITIDSGVSAGNEAYYDTAPATDDSPGDLDTAGTWEVQAKDGSGPWHTDVGELIVKANLPDPT